MTYKQGDSISFDAFVQEIERKRDIATSSGAEVNDDVTKGVLFNNIKNTPGLLAVKALIATRGAYYKLAYHEMRDQFEDAIRLEASTEEEEDNSSPSAVFRFGQQQQACTEQRTARGGPGPRHHADSRGQHGDARYDCDERDRCAGDSRRDRGRCFDCDEKGHYAGDIACKDPSDISRKVQSGIRRHMKSAAEAESKGAAGGTGKAMVAWARDDAPGCSKEKASNDELHPLPADFRSSSDIFLACTTPCTTAASADVCTARHAALESEEERTRTLPRPLPSALRASPPSSPRRRSAVLPLPWRTSAWSSPRRRSAALPLPRRASAWSSPRRRSATLPLPRRTSAWSSPRRNGSAAHPLPRRTLTLAHSTASSPSTAPAHRPRRWTMGSSNWRRVR
jgi:hypothetical protein